MRVGPMFPREGRQRRSLPFAVDFGIRWWTKRRGHHGKDLPKCHREYFWKLAGMAWDKLKPEG